VTVSNADGLLVNGSPYFVYTFNPQFLSPGNKTSTKRWYFSNPKQLRFTYTTIAVAQLPAAQAIIGNGETIVTVSDILLMMHSELVLIFPKMLYL
jgi:hypothetical protein